MLKKLEANNQAGIIFFHSGSKSGSKTLVHLTLGLWKNKQLALAEKGKTSMWKLKMKKKVMISKMLKKAKPR